MSHDLRMDLLRKLSSWPDAQLRDGYVSLALLFVFVFSAFVPIPKLWIIVSL